jgi:hypothetical protein
MGIPRVANEMENIPVEQLWSVLGAVEASYKHTLEQCGFSQSDCRALSSAIIRRLKGQLGADGLTEKEMMIRLCEEIAINGCVAATG